MFKWVLEFILVLALALVATSCAKEHAVDERTAKNTNAGSANQHDPSAAVVAPHKQPTLRGDIERISLAISMAHDAAKLNKPQEAVALLQGAKKEVDTALSRKPRLSDEFEGLKAAIDRTIGTLESRGKEAEIRLTELQTRIGAIKVNTF